MSNRSIRWQVGLETDIEGGKENQDECFVWYFDFCPSNYFCAIRVRCCRMQKSSSAGDRVTVLCVLDGHGREVGKVAAKEVPFFILG